MPPDGKTTLQRLPIRKNNPQINKMIPQVDKVGFWLVLTHLSADYTLLKLIAGARWLYVS